MKKHQALPFVKAVPDTGGIFTLDFGDGAFIPNVNLATCFISISTSDFCFRNFAHAMMPYEDREVSRYPTKETIQVSRIGEHQYALRYDKVFWGIRDVVRGSSFFFETEEKCKRFRDEKQYDGEVIPYFCVNPSFPLFYGEVFDFCIGACEAQIPNANEADSRSERNGYLAAIKDCIDAIKLAQKSGAQRE
ncbi:hypothetical protein [Acetobacter orleanensis]|uniref:Uncharacterized protein n=1 Tax=Acetobacter orleanensis TaxID=104099 RepID=A0A4Y3TQ80_9PROT|nr:hypothetical protein [Acetobacter orleanensis]KXV62563.1 hypothetical protein AD949_10670 [Acetobacter orleanensis]PCD79990.1 hypothetical protein CO710_03800 [Acetobacter orleanensis]GAN68303.1 hypothetical protein Abol_015_142 [Acetobacter orleanensis JCM 7639]GBR27573.1 hypothetical protein AA0473_1475 [Acetobacter orleanensis NRIC 0473]GEB83883.1 hypothetical protein AOR01nite_23600 [Acetobacter orleanensis]